MGKSLRLGNTKSCSCLQKDITRERNIRNTVVEYHNQLRSRHYLYCAWKGMKNRCYNTNSRGYPNWGGRGIEVYGHWKDDFWEFTLYIDTHLGVRPKGYSLDRINNDGNYAPGNVRWATAQEQSKNTRRVMDAKQKEALSGTPDRALSV